MENLRCGGLSARQSGRFLASILVLAVAGLYSCGHSADPQPRAPQQPLISQGGEPLPSVEALDRIPSELVDFRQLGREALMHSEGAVVEGDFLRLEADVDGMEWGIWRLGPTDQRELARVLLLEYPPMEMLAWIAVADFETGRWRHYGQHSAIFAEYLEPPGAAEIDTSKWYLSAERYVYIAAVVWSGEKCLVRAATLDAFKIEPPVADFRIFPQGSEPGAPVQLDASWTHFPNGGSLPLEIINHEWDLDGDGTYETSTGADPTCITALPDPAGTIEVGLKVTDNLGGSGVTRELLTSPYIGWITQIIDGKQTATGFRAISLAEINGKPAIAYSTNIDFHNNVELRYASSSSSDGLSGWSNSTVQATANTEQGIMQASLQQVEGTPAIAYITVPDFNSGQGELTFARSSQPDGAAHWQLESLDTDATELGKLMIADSRPALGYARDRAGMDQEICFAISGLSDGSGAWSTDIALTGEFSWSISSAMVAGRPAIACSSASAGLTPGLQYLSNSEPDGSGTWTAVSLQSENVGKCQLISIADMPVIGFSEEYDQFRLAFGSNPDGNGDWLTQSVIQADDHHLALAEIGQLPAVAFMHPEDIPQGLIRSLTLVRTSKPLGTSDWHSTKDKNWQGYNQYPSLKEIDGRPAVAYALGNWLMYTVLYE